MRFGDHCFVKCRVHYEALQSCFCYHSVSIREFLHCLPISLGGLDVHIGEMSYKNLGLYSAVLIRVNVVKNCDCGLTDDLSVVGVSRLPPPRVSEATGNTSHVCGEETQLELLLLVMFGIFVLATGDRRTTPVLNSFHRHYIVSVGESQNY